MNIGFTGSRNGMTERQISALHWYFNMLNMDDDYEFHHGRCVGADAQAANLAGGYGLFVIAHPSDIVGMQALGLENNKVLEKKPALDRNRDIVDASDILIAAPSTLKEELRSGTWSTIRYARKMGKPVIILDP